MIRPTRLYKSVNLALSAIFAAVGLLFLFAPDRVLVFFNSLSEFIGMVPTPTEGVGFYLILAVAYMYVVALLAFLISRYPTNHQLLFVLINAKLASSLLSFAFFFALHPYLIFLTNGIVDGVIAGGLLYLRSITKGLSS